MQNWTSDTGYRTVDIGHWTVDIEHSGNGVFTVETARGMMTAYRTNNQDAQMQLWRAVGVHACTHVHHAAYTVIARTCSAYTAAAAWRAVGGLRVGLTSGSTSGSTRGRRLSCLWAPMRHVCTVVWCTSTMSGSVSLACAIAAVARRCARAAGAVDVCCV